MVTPKPLNILQTFPGHFINNLKIKSGENDGDEPDESPNISGNPMLELRRITQMRMAMELKRTKEKFEHLSPYGLTALASFPGSGNTWLRYLLQQATGK